MRVRRDGLPDVRAPGLAVRYRLKYGCLDHFRLGTMPGPAADAGSRLAWPSKTGSGLLLGIGCGCVTESSYV